MPENIEGPGHLKNRQRIKRYRKWSVFKWGYLRKGEKRGNYGLFIAMDIKILMTEVQRSLNLQASNSIIHYIILYINI